MEKKNRYRAINVPKLEERKRLLRILEATGIRIDPSINIESCSTLCMFGAGRPAWSLPTIGTYGDQLEPPCYITVKNPSEFVAAVMEELARTPEKVFVKLNAAYNAEVSKDGITVGCQTFPLSIIEDLVEAVRKVKE